MKLDSTLPPEISVLVACARGRIGPEASDRLRRHLSRVASWPQLEAMAQRHSMFPLVAHHALAHASDEIPLAVRERWKSYLQENTRASLALLAHLAAILEALHEHDVPCAPYKGPLLAAELYGNAGLRSSRDLDLFVQKHDLRRAQVALQKIGYRPFHHLQAGQQAALLRFDCESPLTSHEGTVLDLHWNVASRETSLPFPIEIAWQNARRGEFRGLPFHRFLPEHLLLAFCVHAAKHMWSRVLWLGDIAALLASETDMDWDTVFGIARRFRLERMLAGSMALVRQYWDVRPPSHTAESAVEPFLRRVVGEFWPLPTVPDADFWTAHQFVSQLGDRSRDRLRLRVRALWQAMPADIAAAALPAAFSGWYPLVRIVRQTGRHLRQQRAAS